MLFLPDTTLYEPSFESVNRLNGIKTKLSDKYKAKDGVNLNYNKDNNIITMNNSNTDLLFYKRERELIAKLMEMESKKEKIEETGQIMNDFLFELQKLLGVNNPQNLIENIDSLDNDILVKKLQKVYRLVHNKINGK